MANYYGVGKTNLFAVKDLDAFREEVEKFPIEVGAREQDGQTLVQLFDNDPDGAGFAWSYWDSEQDDSVEIEWEEIFARHLVDGWVAIIYEVGNEKYRYLNGTAIAYNNKGEYRRIDIHDITNLAEQIGSKF
jgi:hypothetical protein